MSETRNGARTGLVIFGLLAGIAGIILWIVGATQLANDKYAFDLEKSLDGSFATDHTGGDQTMIWFGIALLAIGVILLLARFIIAAARR